MEIIPLNGSQVNRRWRRKSGYSYNRLHSPTTSRRTTLKIVRLKGSKRSWRLRLHAPKLRLASPLKLWCRFKNAYMKMMLKFANITGTSDAAVTVFGGKRIPQSRASQEAPMASSRADFENRLVLEIYKSMVASLELGYHN